MAYTDDEIKWIYDRTGGRCIYCGTSIVLENFSTLAERGAWDINSFIPRLNSGERERNNWVPACIICDTVKGECFPWEYDSRRFLQEDENPDNYIKKKDGTSPA